MVLLATMALLAVGVPAQAATRTVDAVYERQFCQEPQHRQSRFCDGRGISADDPRREAFRWYVLRERCRVSRAPEYCKDIEGVVPDRPVLVLTYDHSAGRWDLEGTKRESRSSLDANGRPTVYAGSQDSVLVVITNSNPLIYGSSVGEVKEAEIAQIAVLQSLMTGLGSALQSWVTMAGQPSTEATSSSGSGLMGAERSVADAIAAVIAERQRRVLLLSDESVATKHAIDVIGRCREAMVALLQQLELGRPTPYSCRPLEESPASPARSVTAGLRQRYEDAAWFGVQYKPAIARFLALLQMSWAPPDVVKARIGEVRQSLNSVPAEGAPPVLLTLAAESQEALDRIAWADDVHAALVQEGRRFAALDRALVLEDADQKLVTAIETVLAKSADINLAAAVLDAAERRYANNLVGGVPRMWFEVTPPSTDVSWDVIRTYPITVAADAAYANQVALAHPAKSATSYALASTNSRLFGVDVGVTATNIVDREFGAVADPAAPKQKVIAQTGETNRSGQFGIFLDYWIVQRWRESAADWAVRPGVQIGAAFSSDNPAVHAGGVLELAKYARFGGGVTFQRVTRLDGQQVGDPVSSSDDIRTRDRFARGWYVSFAFALDSLSLFGGH